MVRDSGKGIEPEALPRLSLEEISQMAGPLSAKAGMRLSAWRPIRLMRDGTEVVLRIPPQRGLKYLGAQAIQAGVGVVGIARIKGGGMAADCGPGPGHPRLAKNKSISS